MGISIEPPKKRHHAEIMRELKIHMLMKKFPEPDYNRLIGETDKRLFGIRLPFFEKVDDNSLYHLLVEISKFGVISGSVVLKLLGLIDREISDLDVLVHPSKIEYEFLNFIKNSEGINHGNYGIVPDLNCFRTIEYKGAGYNNQIDFFTIEKDTEIFEHEGIRYENPISIIYNKMKLYNASIERQTTASYYDKIRYKDIDDFNKISKRMI